MTTALWCDEFGDNYTERNQLTDDHLQALIKLWTRILSRCSPWSVLEIGANNGINLRAINALTSAELFAVEPNNVARKSLADIVPDALDNVASNIELSDNSVDLAFTSGVLIHIPPDELLPSCQEIYRVARKHICCIEYFSDVPEEKTYRDGEVLWKRDFGSYWLDNFPDLEVADYGFAWKRMTGLDNLTWWLFSK